MNYCPNNVVINVVGLRCDGMHFGIKSVYMYYNALMKQITDRIDMSIFHRNWNSDIELSLLNSTSESEVT